MSTPNSSQAFVWGTIASVLILTAVAVMTYVVTPWPAKKTSGLPGVDETDPAAALAPVGSGGGNEPTVASLSPAGTDVLIGIGSGNHLVAISDLDEEREGVGELPRIGDFNHVDWEKLAAINPKILLTQFGSRMPAGLRERCAQMNITVIDVKLDTIDDVYTEADVLGRAVGDEVAEGQAVAGLKRDLARIAAANANLPPVRAAIAVSDGGAVNLIGPGTFHDQLLTIAGGVNVAAGIKMPFIAVDAEKLNALAPEVILDLEPQPPTTPQQMRQAARFWASVPDVPAVREKRVRTVTVPYALRPGWKLAEMAGIFSEALHGRGR
jgi:iron complex transport system substrate-binding protein